MNNERKGTRYPGLSVMWKTVSNSCNLACDYCYFDGCNGLDMEKVRIQESILESFMQQYMPLTSGVASFAWQGGEPMLAGLDFFKRVVDLQMTYAPPHTTLNNAIQTNGTLITDEWAQFFKHYRFLVGVSLDGSRMIHNKRRPFGSGAGSYDAVMKGLEVLRRHQVDFNVLTVIHEDNVDKADELMDFYEREGLDYVQFIPAMNFKAQETEKAGDYLISPQQYGDFLCRTFDRWLQNGRPQRSVRQFDNLLSQTLNHPAELCTHRARCPLSLVIESNGDVFPCDFFMDEGNRLGNLKTDALTALLDSTPYAEFLSLKSRLPDACMNCEYLSQCHGGCPRNRNWMAEKPQVPDYFCASYRQLYAHSQAPLEVVATRIRTDWKQQWQKAGHALPSRNEACFCGSGLKYKKCCGQS
ncbi:anaerobic sulfatase maturase [Marinicrinis sediminis]|uniref:Anaerobic sulfatase maturase n=1 Tax=Marinicrinis sediminis TaxID=1652465 RepID=A0ABW5R6X2_9BACL